jgi:chorismate mutase-like protein
VTTISQYRDELDRLDDQLLSVLAQRLNICREIGLVKLAAKMSVDQPDRVKYVKERAATVAEQLGVDSQFAVQIYDLIIEETCRIEDEVVNHVYRDKRASTGASPRNVEPSG